MKSRSLLSYRFSFQKLFVFFLTSAFPFLVHSGNVYNSDSLINSSINKAIEYLRLPDNHMFGVDVLTFTNLINKNYNLHLSIPPVDTIKFTHPHLYENAWPVTGIVDTSLRFNQYNLGQFTGYKWIVSASIFCHTLNIGNKLADSIEYYAGNKEGNDATHAAFCLFYALKNKCIADDERIKKINTVLSEKMVNIYLDKKNEFDLRVQSLTMLSLLGGNDKISKEWLLDVIKNQQEDGGWHPGLNCFENNESSPHTTVFALWLLLRTSYPEN